MSQSKSSETRVRFQLENVTKGAYRYQEIDNAGKILELNSGAKIGWLYIRKATLPGVPPNQIIVTLEVAEKGV